MKDNKNQTPCGAATDNYWMQRALKLAKRAAERGEVPVGALIVDKSGEILSQAYNSREYKRNPLGHAELLAIYRASLKRRSWRLNDCTLYVTLEPCPMCAGAIVQARIPEVVYGARDPKSGAAQSLFQILSDSRLNHQAAAREGVLADESRALLQSFFKSRRKRPPP